MSRKKNINEQVGTNDTCPKCGQWMGPVHICPEQIARDCEIQPTDRRTPAQYQAIIKRLEGELHNANGYVESTRVENKRLQRVESEIDAWVSAHDGDISQVNAIDIIIKAAIKAEADWLDATQRP